MSKKLIIVGLMVFIIILSINMIVLSEQKATSTKATKEEVKLEKTKITQEVIVFKTNRKKENGNPTQVTFHHKTHTTRTSCTTCHPTIKQELHSSENKMMNVHKVCFQCHRKGKRAEKVSKCSDCHKVPKAK